MNKQEIAKIIESKAAEYGLKLQENTMGWTNESNHDSYIRIEVRKERDYDKTDWEARKVFWTSKQTPAFARWVEIPRRRSF